MRKNHPLVPRHFSRHYYHGARLLMAVRKTNPSFRSKILLVPGHWGMRGAH